MEEFLQLVQRARKIAEGTFPEGRIVHYLLPDGKVLEVVFR